MAKNNHFNLSSRKELDELLLTDESSGCCDALSLVLDYARFLATIKNAIVVVSDMANGKSHIQSGGFARRLGLEEYHHEDSIWEHKILSLMTERELEEKYIAELRFFHFLRHIPKGKRMDYYLISKLRFRFADGNIRIVLHSMYYIYNQNKETIKYAICIYEPLIFDFHGKSHAVNSITGIAEELTSSSNDAILSRRECQVLSLIDSGLKSAEIAEHLNISIHTVSRHRQEIIGKLQVRNSHQACRIAKSMKLI